jgi:hypothetical protein
MSGRRTRDELEEDEPEITAQPIGMPEQLASRGPNHEVGLSVDADELGRNFLSDATEQGNFESAYDESVERYVSEESRNDDALAGPNFDPDSDVWENTVNLTLQGGEALMGPLVDDHIDGMRVVEGEDEQTESDDVDLTQNTVTDASLLDREGDEYGETASPEVTTEDAHTHAQKRGGHRSKAKPASTSRTR